MTISLPVPSTTKEIQTYYSTLLIMQYLNKPNATGQIEAFAGINILPQTSTQTIAFSIAPSSGTFVLSYDDVNSAAINWNDSASTIQGKLQAISGLGSLTVTGSIASLSLYMTFTGVIAPALSLVLVSNTLSPASTISITETDLTLPLAVQNAYNLLGDDTAVGVQLDVLGEYVGVTRSGLGFATNTPITLDDSDFLSLIKMAIIRNTSGSSLSTIQTLLNKFFPGEMFVVDSKLMFLTFIISSEVGSQDLVQLFVTEGLLPVPMAVGYNVIYGPTSKYFSFTTYENIVNPGYPMNTYESYDLMSPWLIYEDVIYP